MAKEDERFAKHQKRGQLWVLRVRYSRESVRSTGFKQAMDIATPAQKATLMDLAQLREVGELTFHTRASSARRKMFKRWEAYMEKLGRDAENVSVPPRAYSVDERRPSQTVSSAQSHNISQDDTLHITISIKEFEQSQCHGDVAQVSNLDALAVDAPPDAEES